MEALAVLEGVFDGDDVVEDDEEVDLEKKEADEEGLGLELILKVFVIVLKEVIDICAEKETLCVKDFIVVIVWVIVNSRDMSWAMEGRRRRLQFACRH